MEKKTDFKTLPAKSKMQYIWDYYRWHIIGGICIAAFVISLVVHYATYKDPILEVLMVNCNDSLNGDESSFDDFLEEYGYDKNKSPVSLYSSLKIVEGDSLSYQDQQALMLVMAGGQQDVFFANEDVFMGYADQGMFVDLSTYLPKDLLEKYKDSLIYSTNDGTVDAYPCAVELKDNQWVQENEYYESCYYGVFLTANESEPVKQFTEYLLNYNETHQN